MEMEKDAILSLRISCSLEFHCFETNSLLLMLLMLMLLLMLLMLLMMIPQNTGWQQQLQQRQECKIEKERSFPKSSIGMNEWESGSQSQTHGGGDDTVNGTGGRPWSVSHRLSLFVPYDTDRVLILISM